MSTGKGSADGKGEQWVANVIKIRLTYVLKCHN